MYACIHVSDQQMLTNTSSWIQCCMYKVLIIVCVTQVLYLFWYFNYIIYDNKYVRHTADIY